MVVVPPRGVVSGYHVVPGAFILVRAGRVGREGIRAVPLWYDGLWGPDGRDDGPVRVKEPDVRAVLIANPERPIIVDDQALAIYRDALGSIPVGGVGPEAVPGVCCGGELWEPVVLQAARAVCVKAGCWLPVGSAEEYRVDVVELQVGRCRVVSGGIGFKNQSDMKLVNAVDKVCMYWSVTSTTAEKLTRKHEIHG